MRKLYPVLAAVPAAILAVGASAASADPPEDAGNGSGGRAGNAPDVYEVDLDPLNGSGVEGTARLKVQNGTLKVKVKADGLVPNQVHPQHIHGFDSGKNADCPEPEDRDDRENSPKRAENPEQILSVPEGLPDYGEIRLPLKPFPVANPNGKISFTERYDIDDLEELNESGLDELERRHIVVHGSIVQSDDPGQGEIYLAQVPVACGQIEQVR